MANSKAGRALAANPLGLVLMLLSAATLLVGLVGCDFDAPTSTATATIRAAGSGPRLSFKETERDFGQINYKEKMEYRWAFTNTGDAPLQIRDIRTEPIDPTS